MKFILPDSLHLLIDRILLSAGLHLTNFIINKESVKYHACSFTVNGKLIQYRTAQIAPTKSGQLVTIWKRNELGITVPF